MADRLPRANRAEHWVREKSSDLITRVIEEQREQTRIVLREQMEGGTHPRTIARNIIGKVNPATKRREGELMGLDGPRSGVLKSVTETMKAPEGVRSLVVEQEDRDPLPCGGW